MPKRLNGIPVTPSEIPGDPDHGLEATDRDESTWRALLRKPDKKDKAGIVQAEGEPLRGDWASKNVEILMSNDPRFRSRGQVLVGWDEFAHVAYCPNPFEDFRLCRADEHVLRALGSWMATVYSFPPSDGAIERALLTVAKMNGQAFHPVVDWLDELHWDGTHRADRFLVEGFGADDSMLHRAFGLRFLVGMSARVLDPGCKLDTMPLAQGPEGIGKSQALKALAGDWFNDTKLPLDDPRRMGMLLQGTWIHEWAELESMRGAAIETVKAMLSSSEDLFVPMYGRTVQKVKRSCVFFGTTNDRYVLEPGHSNRRFWPFSTTGVDVEWIRTHRDQLMAEAVEAYRSGEQWHLSDQEEAVRRKAARGFTVDDAILSRLSEFLAMPINRSGIPFHKAKEACQGITGRYVNVDRDVARCMELLGWERERDQRGQRLWVPRNVIDLKRAEDQ